MKSRSPALVEPCEFARFVVTGVIATLANLGAVWVLRQSAGYEAALLYGIGAGFAVSFLLTKLFAFRPGTGFGAASGGELARFLLVYGLGVCVNMAAAVMAGRVILPLWLPLHEAEMAGALIGAGTMTFTGYFGHRFFTYRTGRRRPG